MASQCQRKKGEEYEPTSELKGIMICATQFFIQIYKLIKGVYIFLLLITYTLHLNIVSAKY